MKKEELQQIIAKLEAIAADDDPIWAMYQFGGGPDESFATANKKGLELMAAQLLKASVDIAEMQAEEESRHIPLDFRAAWMDGDIFIHYI